jgi:cytochrome c oxidase assembly factor CtaG
MTGVETILSAWEFEPSVVLGCPLILTAYLYAVRFRLNFKTINFTLGVLTVFLALTSPIDALGDTYLFSAHMVQHMMLGMIAPVLMVAGIPDFFVVALQKVPVLGSLERILSNPLLAFTIANATFWAWHLPVPYNLTLANEHVHIAEHMMFIVTGAMLWWPVFHPIPERRMHPLPAMLYLAAAAALSTILGIIFTVSETPYYSCYANPDDELGILKMIREDWGINQLADQKMGGAIMWEPAGAIFLWAIMAVMIDWFKSDSKPSPVLAKETLVNERRQDNVGVK